MELKYNLTLTLLDFFVLTKGVEMLKGKAALFSDFCACFHSRDQCDLRSLISPHSFPGGDTDLARQTNTVTAAENADLLPGPGLCFLFSEE